MLEVCKELPIYFLIVGWDAHFYGLVDLCIKRPGLWKQNISSIDWTLLKPVCYPTYSIYSLSTHFPTLKIEVYFLDHIDVLPVVGKSDSLVLLNRICQYVAGSKSYFILGTFLQANWLCSFISFFALTLFSLQWMRFIFFHLLKHYEQTSYMSLLSLSRPMCQYPHTSSSTTTWLAFVSITSVQMC